MEEADLLRERLQAITEKRRIQEDIAKKRREIEELKLKLQYLKKKALREQWLMDGVSGQSKQDEEAMRVQAQEEQQQAEHLQSHIDRIESEIGNLETKEMSISVNEELILKRLKEVEKSAEDIIKEVNGDVQPEQIQYIYSAISDGITSFTPTVMRGLNNPVEEPGGKPEKMAMYAMEISVEKDLRTGKSQVLSTATVTPQDFQQKGIKVYEDGRKSVYAVQCAGDGCEDGVDELSPLDVEELLRKATQKKSLVNVEYHEPVFSTHYSRPSTPRKGEQGLVSPAPSGFQTPSKIPIPLYPDCIRKEEADTNMSSSPITQPKTKQCLDTSHSAYQHARNGQTANLNSESGSVRSNIAELIQEPEEQERFTSEFDSEVGIERYSPLHPNNDSAFNIVDSIPSELDSSEPVTMIFMGYQNAESDEEDEAIKAELVIIGNEEEKENDEEAPLSYHPQGYHSKIFQPRNDNIHRSEVRRGVIRSHSSGGYLMRQRGEGLIDSVFGMRAPQLGKHEQLPQSKIPGSHI